MSYKAARCKRARPRGGGTLQIPAQPCGTPACKLQAGQWSQVKSWPQSIDLTDQQTPGPDGKSNTEYRSPRPGVAATARRRVLPVRLFAAAGGVPCWDICFLDG